MTETYRCPHPEDESDAYLLNGIWYQDIEPEFYECTHPSCHAECVKSEDFCSLHLAEVEYFDAACFHCGWVPVNPNCPACQGIEQDEDRT